MESVSSFTGCYYDNGAGSASHLFFFFFFFLFQTPLYNFLCKFRAQLLPMLTTTVWLHNCNHKFACSQKLDGRRRCRRLLEIFFLSKLFPHTPLAWVFFNFSVSLHFAVFSVFQPTALDKGAVEVEEKEEQEQAEQGEYQSWIALQFPLHLQPP